jgi:hypothetical protein
LDRKRKRKLVWLAWKEKRKIEDEKILGFDFDGFSKTPTQTKTNATDMNANNHGTILFNLENQSIVFLDLISCKENKCSANFKIILKLLLNYSS